MIELTAETVRKLLRYDPKAGELYWRRRSQKWFPSKKAWKTWNVRFSGQRALTAISRGYRVGFVLSKYCTAHRIIWLMMTGEWPNHIDHVNGIRNDNRWCNLRSVSQAQNNKNKRIGKNNKSGQLGVYWNKSEDRWVSQIYIDGKCKYLGHYVDFDEACTVRKQAELEYHFNPNHGRME